MKDGGDKIDQADKDNLNSKVSSLKEAIAANNIDSIKSQSEDLQKAMYEVSTKLYQQAAPNGAQQQDPNAAQADPNAAQQNAGPNVYDADYKDVDNQ